MMPDEEFLETYPLYRKFEIEVHKDLRALPRVAIKMWCPLCNSEQTFNLPEDLSAWGSGPGMPPVPGLHPAHGELVRLDYTCAHCGVFERVFFIAIDPEGHWLMKVGQFPAWQISVDPAVSRLLGKERARLYRNGLVCESQSYGIGAFAYYRRVVEEVIDDLLGQISGLMAGEELERYKKALEATKDTNVAQDKIKLVKDLLPASLKPDGINPLDVLHSALSEGLHAGTDEECLEQASIIRQALLFLVREVVAGKEAVKSFTSGMRKLLDKRSARTK